MNRFEFALQASHAPHRICLSQLTKELSQAVAQSIAEGEEPSTDPAVLLLGSFVAFQCHADVNTASGYHRLLALCNERLYNTEILQ